jgi:hypothetical protein
MLSRQLAKSEQPQHSKKPGVMPGFVFCSLLFARHASALSCIATTSLFALRLRMTSMLPYEASESQ